MVSVMPGGATVRCLANVRLAVCGPALQGRDVLRTERSRARSIVDSRLPSSSGKAPLRGSPGAVSRERR